MHLQWCIAASRCRLLATRRVGHRVVEHRRHTDVVFVAVRRLHQTEHQLTPTVRRSNPTHYVLAFSRYTRQTTLIFTLPYQAKTYFPRFYITILPSISWTDFVAKRLLSDFYARRFLVRGFTDIQFLTCSGLSWLLVGFWAHVNPLKCSEMVASWSVQCHASSSSSSTFLTWPK